eukprot:TRINITY_DN5067_c0_g1_i1.p1 TRINITY_DN5067_c0_g1~~TRINITY_DN5067_c0_g1_i1.p1  ORF type:complete len:645 (+),score=102.82 TRINITY_DN5067_c0_g1_i1:2479-4413(+)
MVRIGLVKKAQPVVEAPPVDVDMDDDSSTTSSSTEGRMMSEECQLDVRQIPYRAPSSMMIDITGEGKAFSDLVNDVADLASRNLSSGRSFATLPQLASDESMTATTATQIVPSNRAPVDIQIVNPSLSAALKKLQIHPSMGADELQLAHGLAFRPSWNPTTGELILPAFAKVDPLTERDGVNSSASLIEQHSILGVEGIATQPLSVLCRYASQDDSCKVLFDVASPTHLLTSVLDEIAISFSTASLPTATPSSSIEYLKQSGMEHASLTVKLLKSLFGNEPNDDAYDAQEQSMKTTVLGTVNTKATLTVAYEESNRRRRLKEWLLTHGNLNKNINGNGVTAESDQVSSGRRTEVSRECRKTRRYAESILLLTSTSDDDVRRLLHEDATKSSLLSTSCNNSISSGSWIRDFHQYLTLSDRNSEPSLRELISNYFNENRQCRPPFYEKLSAPEVEKTDQVKTILANGSDKNDICWYILQLWAGQGSKIHDVTSALCDPMTWQHSYGDYSLNWIICVLLSNSPAVPCTIPEDRITSLTCAFVDQLVHMGAWQWALFVALTIPSESARKRISIGVISRNISSFRLTNRLVIHNVSFEVPKSWVEEAASLMTPVPPVRKRPLPVPVPLSPYIEIRTKVDDLISSIYDTV